jgi:hypothetical protein
MAPASGQVQPIVAPAYWQRRTLRELLRTNNLVLLSRLTALLAEEGIQAFVFDAHSSSILGDSVGLLQRRLMVAEDDFARAERIRAALGEPMPRD